MAAATKLFMREAEEAGALRVHTTDFREVTVRLSTNDDTRSSAIVVSVDPFSIKLTHYRIIRRRPACRVSLLAV